jgi:alkaline phosphatase
VDLFNNLYGEETEMELTSLSKRRLFAGVMAAGLAAVIALVGFNARGDAQAPGGPASVVIISGDGMGIQQRTAIQYATYGLKVRQPMDALPVTGFLDTIPRGRSVSDSAAGATAWAIGQKTRNGLVGLPPTKERVPTLLEIAKEQGKSTGLVNDHDITNATLASFGAPIDNRDRKRAIARRLLRGTQPDVMMGGTEKYWYPVGHPGKIPNESHSEDRSRNSQNLVAEAIDKGYQYAWNRDTVQDLTGPKALALVQDSGLQRWKEVRGYKPKQDPFYVPEADLLEKSLEILSQNPNGFFLVAESDDMDSAAHEHDGKNVIATGRTINAMVEVVQEFREENPNILLIVTADHETGGMTIEPKNETNTNSDGDDPVPYYGDGHLNNAGPNGEVPKRSGPFPIKGTDRVFKVDWTTPEHTGGMVPVTAAGPLSEMFMGVHHNTRVFDVAQQVLTD